MPNSLEYPAYYCSAVCNDSLRTGDLLSTSDIWQYYEEAFVISLDALEVCQRKSIVNLFPWL